MMNAKSTSSTQEVGVVLKQLTIVPSEKTTPRGTKKDKMAAGSRRRKKARRRTKSIDNTRTVELRKERSRDAARSRRGKENAQFDELAKLLPLPSAITSQLDKASIVRLTISYLNIKQFNLPRIAKRFRQSSDCSILSESSASPQSEADADAHYGSPGSPTPNSSLSSPTAVASSSAVVPYNQNEITLQDLADNSGIFLLQALDGFMLVLSSDGKILYVSETVSVHLGLSQVELTGSNISCYIHPEDHQDVLNVLDAAKEEVENSNKAAAGMYTDNIPFFGNQQPFSGSDDQPTDEKPKSFFMRMKCTLVRRGGAYTKSSGFKVIHCMGRMKKYFTKGIPENKYAFVAIGQPLPTMNINELPLECNMFVSRVNMDLKIVYCEGRIHKFMDYFARDIVGISAYDFYHANDIGVIQGHHAKFLTKGQVLTKYYRWMNKNGGWVWMQTKASLIPHPTNPELKQMLCLNYLVSDVEHRGVVLGMAQLEDKPSLEPKPYITEVENEADDSGELKDAQFDDQVMVYPKWHETSDNLVPKPTLLDQMALTRSGYPRASGCEVPILDEVFTTSPGEPCSKAATTTSWSTPHTTRGYSGQGDSTSTFEDEFEDLTEIINAELTKLDREIVHFVANGPIDAPSTSQLPNPNLESVLNSSWLDGLPSNGTVQGGLPLGAPKIEPISMEEDIDYNEPRIQPSDIPSQTLGNLPVGSYPDDTKPSLTEQDNMLFQLSSSKMRGVNNPCMFSNGNSAGERNYQKTAPTLNNSVGNVPMMGMPQQKPSVSSTRNANNLNTSGVMSGNAAYTSNPQDMMSGRLRPQRPITTSTVTSGGPGSQMANPKESHLQFVQLLKDTLPDNLAYTDEMVVDLVDDMIIDQNEAQRRANDLRMASLLQQGGYIQPEAGLIKQEVVTPTLPQETFSFPTLSNTMSSQSSQPHMTSGSATQSFTGTFTSTDTFNRHPGSETTFGVTSQRPQNGTVNNQGSSLTYQNGNSQFMNQEDSNMNFLNSLSNAGLTNNYSGLPASGSTSWTKNQPSQSVMQQGLRNLLQSTNSTPSPKQNTNPGLVPQSNMPFLPQQNVNLMPPNGSRTTQGNSFNATMVPSLSQLDSLLQSTQLPASNYQNLNGTNMSFGNQSYRKL